jgi:hypothetical protein
MIGAARDQANVASRLSAMLWSSIPDETLIALSQEGKLGDRRVMQEQIKRMLASPKASRFVNDFTGQWLRLREIEANPPDKQLYPEFMPWLQESMLHESRAFFKELLFNDLPISNFVKSDFAMLNEPLAEHYGLLKRSSSSDASHLDIDRIKGFAVRRVSLPKDSIRGGFLTQGAILKVTANGTTTSPVKRGAFVMEQILGIVPTPPPPDIGSIEPNTEGAITIREQLEKHKRSETCAACHVKMDPYGFALESFDVVGQWRDRVRVRGSDGKTASRPMVHGHGIDYRYDPVVDCSGQLPDGRSFANVAELQTLLAENDRDLARAFVGHLVHYGTGVDISFSERAEVESILERAKASQYGVKTLLTEVITSPLFMKP